jgi:hypothetical protein
MRTGLAPWIPGTLIVWIAFAWGLRRGLEPGPRVLLLVLLVGLFLAQLNAFKLDRILVPLLGNLFVIAGTGAAALLLALRNRTGRLAVAGASALLLGLFFVAPRDYFVVRQSPVRAVNEVISAGILLAEGAEPVDPPPTVLWVGSARIAGQDWITVAYLHARAAEIGRPRADGKLWHLSDTMMRTAGFLHGNTVDARAFREWLGAFDAVVFVSDWSPRGPRFLDPVHETLRRAVQGDARFAPAGGSEVQLPGLSQIPGADVIRVTAFRRVR